MQARFETPTKARSTGHTPKPLIVGDRAAIAAAVNEYISTPEKPLLTPDKRIYGGVSSLRTIHHLNPCSVAGNFQQPGYTGVKHPIFDLTDGPYDNHSGSTTLAESKEKNSNFSENSLRNHIDPFIVGNGSKNRFFAVTKNSDEFETLSPCASNSDGSAKTVKSPAGIALPSSPAHNAKGDNNEISGENAQSFYTPESCIFVANLPMAYSDHQLQKEIQLMYGAFGECYVKVRRDSQGMPYAFVQYTKPASAEDAIEKGGNMLVGGRACRVEPAKVPSKFFNDDMEVAYIRASMKVNKSLSGTVFLFKANGSTLSVEQAKEFLQKFGPVQKAWTPSDTEQEMFGLPSGVFVRFMYYDHCQEALEKTRNEKTFHLQRKDDLAKTSSSRAFPRTSHVDHNGSHHGSNAIWIGSIQGDWASAQVLKNFYGRRVGSVSGAFVGAGSFGEKQSKYALVWFHERNAVSKAVECDTSELNVFNGGVPLRVQRKRSKPQTPEKRMGHVQSSPDDGFMRSPFNGGPVHHPMFMTPNMTPDHGRNFGFIHPMFQAVHPAYQTMQSPGLPYPSFNGHFPVQPNGLPGGFSPNTFSTPNESPTARGFQNGYDNLAMPRSESMPLYNGYLDRRF